MDARRPLTHRLRALHCLAATLGVLIPSVVNAAEGTRNPHCRPVGGTVMTNFISNTTTLGPATGDLRGAVSATLLGQVSQGDSIVFSVQHHWVTETGDTIIMDPAQATTKPLTSALFAILSYPVTITGGTGRFEGASGHLDVIGELDAATGRTGFRYQGEVCFAPPSK